MVTAGDVFDAAMALMDELDASGSARTTDTAEYENRTPGILNALASEYLMLSGAGSLVTVESLEDVVLNVPDTYSLGVLNYGLAANLLVDENPAAASFYEQRYEQLRDAFLARDASEAESVDIYGGIEYGSFGRW